MIYEEHLYPEAPKRTHGITEIDGLTEALATAGSSATEYIASNGATAKAYYGTSGGGSLYMGNNVSSGGTVDDATKPAWRMVQSQSGDSVRWDRAAAGAGWTPTTLFTLDNTGSPTFLGLSGTGTRMVVASSAGVLSTQTIPSGGGGDASTNTATSVDGEAVLFSGTTGKIVKRSTLTGMVKQTSGVPSAATSGTDYSAGTAALATGIVKSTTTTGALSIAVAGTDYAAATEPLAVKVAGDIGGTAASPTVTKINGTSLAGLATGLLKNTTTTGVPSIAVAGTDYAAATEPLAVKVAGDIGGTAASPTVTKINGTSMAGLATGILKNTTTTGVPSIAVAADFPTLNQNTTGSAATLTTARTIAGVSFNGSANIAIASTNLSDTASIVLLTTTQTLTNKRVTKRTGTTTSSATPTINTDNVDFYSLTAQAVDITSFTTNLTGTPTEGQTLWIAITGTAARAITWGASFEASTVALPTTTVTTARLDVGFVWNTVTSKWRCVASA
jgi:hypothetical protein